MRAPKMTLLNKILLKGENGLNNKGNGDNKRNNHNKISRKSFKKVNGNQSTAIIEKTYNSQKNTSNKVSKVNKSYKNDHQRDKRGDYLQNDYFSHSSKKNNFKPWAIIPEHKDMTVDEEEFKIGLVLAAGGAKGLAHIGVLEVLDKYGIKISAIAGSSIGSIIGAYYALGYSGKQIEQIALRFDKKKIKKLFDLRLPINSLIKGKKTENYLLDMFDDLKFSDLKIPFYPVATNLKTGKAKVFNKDRLVDAIEASIALPMIYEPKKIGKQEYIDGGVVDPFPIMRIKKSVDFTIGVRLPFNYEKLFFLSKVRILYVISKTISIMEENLTDKLILKCPPSFLFNMPSLKKYNDFDFDKAKEIIAIGRRVANFRIKELMKRIESEKKRFMRIKSKNK